MFLEGRTFPVLFPAMSTAPRAVPGVSFQPYHSWVRVWLVSNFLSFLGGFLQCLGRLFRLEVLRIQPTGSGLILWDPGYKYPSSFALQMRSLRQVFSTIFRVSLWD